MELLKKIDKQTIEDFFAIARRVPALCCSEGTEGAVSCRNSARLLAWVEGLKPCQAVAGTITIGNKFYGKMSYKDQYKCMVRRIKDFYRFGGIKYIATFELQNNGNLHSHLLILGDYISNFKDLAGVFGERNKHPSSFQTCREPQKYFEYMLKEQILPTIHNIKNDDIINPTTRKTVSETGPKDIIMDTIIMDDNPLELDAL